MIRIKIRGRLGNQLFIYSFARKLTRELQQDALIYDRKSEDDSIWHSHLDAYVLNNSIKFTSDKYKVFKMGIVSLGLYCIYVLYMRTHSRLELKNFEDKYRHLYLKRGLLLCDNGYFPLEKYLNEIPEDVYVAGYFQSPRFFSDIRGLLLDELSPRTKVLKKNLPLLTEIKSSESVCITIRLGDFINNPIHQVCDIEYFTKAIKLMNRLEPNCKYFVFSDEIDKVKEIFDFGADVVFDKGDNDDYESLRIMSNCKHFIISNSTFSWWAEYLSKNEGKIVIAPHRWYATDDMPCDIQEENWLYV